MNQRPLVIKLGGAVLSSIDTLTLLFKTISNYQQQAKRSLIIVHGGGYLVDELMAKLQLETIKKRGVTSYSKRSDWLYHRCVGWNGK